MKKTSIIIIAIFFSVNLFGQEKIKTRRKTINHVLYYELFKVLKEDKTIKHGNYKRLRHVSAELLETGEYKYGKKIGVWDYYIQTGQVPELEQKYDYDNDSLIFYKEGGSNEYKCFYNGKWKILPLSSQPIHIGGRMNLYHKIIDNIKISKELAEKKTTGDIVLSFEINTEGKISNIKTILGLNDECDSLVINSIKKTEILFIPAQYNGEKMIVEFPIAFSFRYTESVGSDGKVDKYYFIDTPFKYGGFIRNPEYN